MEMFKEGGDLRNEGGTPGLGPLLGGRRYDVDQADVLGVVSQCGEVVARLCVRRTWPDQGPWEYKLPRGRPQFRVRQGGEGWGAGVSAVLEGVG